jgi:hypothetical protein
LTLSMFTVFFLLKVIYIRLPTSYDHCDFFKSKTVFRDIEETLGRIFDWQHTVQKEIFKEGLNLK